MTDAFWRKCPPAETLAAFLEGNLSGQGRADVARHLESCSDCMLALSEAARFEREELPAEPRRRPSWIPAAAAAALLVVLGGAAFNYRLRSRDPMAGMIQVAMQAKERPADTRLSGFPWAPVRTVTRGAGDALDPDVLRVRSKAGEIMNSNRSRSDAAARHAVGLAHFLAGDPVPAVDDLQAAVAREETNAGYWNDLAAVLYATENMSGALNAVEHALKIDPSLAEALFNRALILERFKFAGASHAWSRYLEVDASSPWAAEARRRLGGSSGAVLP